MSFIPVVSAVVRRIQHLLVSLDGSECTPNWRNDAEDLLSGLEQAKALLMAADQAADQAADEFKIATGRIVYAIDHSLAAAQMDLILSKSTRRFSRVFSKLNPEGTHKTNIQEKGKQLVQRLNFGFPMPKKSEQDEKTSTIPAQAKLPLPANPSTAEDLPAAGMEDQVIEALLKEGEFPVVWIGGKSGMGKTTLAKKVFFHGQVREHFDFFAWVYIKQDFQTKEVLQDILLQLLPFRKVQIMGMYEIQLTQLLFHAHKVSKCLVVLENISTKQDWESIRVAFPIGDSISKILITTPSREVAAEAAASEDEICEMKPLAEPECFKMLMEKANFDDDDELQSVGRAIFRLCGGSPFLALALGISLKTKNAARDQLLHELHSFQVGNQTGGGETKALKLIYNALPDGLKPCLLYMSRFPEGQDIQVEKLYLLLAAEFLIESPEKSTSGRETTLMESVRNILDELALRMLVEVREDKGSMTRILKSGRLNDQIRDFCRSVGGNEDFFGYPPSERWTPFAYRVSRLSIHLSESCNFIFLPRTIRSLLIFDNYESEEKSWPIQINDILEKAIHVIVLDFDGVDFRFRKFPKGIDKLLLLTYLSFQGCYLEDFPYFISNFQHLETLDLRIRTNCKMTIPYDILNNLKRLKHLFFPMAYESDGNNKLQLHDLTKLEILVNFDTGVCKVEDLSEFNSINILTIISQGNSKDLDAIIHCLEKRADNLQQSSVSIRNFDCYTKDRAATFKNFLKCKYLHSLNIEGQIGQLPKDVAVSPNITEMVFDGSELEHDPMNVFGKLQNLRSLVLLNDAFMGSEMTFSATSDFPNLRILKLLNLQYLEKITFEEGAMPSLSTLVIGNCDDLETVKIPKSLDSRLKKLAQGNKGDDVYSVDSSPTVIEIYDN